MSYILDALKKSERARPPGTVPDLFTVHGPQTQPASPRWPTRAIIAGALLLAVPAVALWAWIGTGRRDEGAVRSPVAASPQPLTEEAPARATPPAVVAPPPSAPARVVASARRPLDKRSQPPPSFAQKSRATAASPAGRPALTAAPASVPAAPVAMTPATEVEGDALSAPVSTTSAFASAEAPPADGRVLDFAELPAPVRAELPKLLVSGHVWSEEPSMRLLSVDDRLLHEGGEAAPGVSLREITPAGAVFVFKGWHFRVAGGRP